MNFVYKSVFLIFFAYFSSYCIYIVTFLSRSDEAVSTEEEWMAEEDSSDLLEGIGGRDPSPPRKRARGALPSSAKGGSIKGKRSGGGRATPSSVGRPQGHGSKSSSAELEGITVCSNAAPSTKSYDHPDISNTLPPFQPKRPPGIHFGTMILRDKLTTELEFFKLFFTAEIVASIATHTNTYAFSKIIEGGYTSYTKSDGSWEETNVAEVYKLIALMIYFGLVKISSSYSKYWSTQSLYHGLWARAIMSRARYKALMGFLHVVDPGTETPGDKLRKVEQFISSFRERCHLLHQPNQNMAVDERMVKSKHRSGIRQYMKNKPTKYGLKLWVLADSSNAYTQDFNVYIGKSAHGETSNEGLGYDVVMELVKPYLNQGYHLFFDNFYTSHKLVSDLFLQGTPSSGTARTSRVGFPKSLSDLKVWARKKKRGMMRWERNSNVLTVQWIDCKPVSLLTTIDSANEKVEVKRRTKKDGKFQEVNVPQPLAFHRYNQYMNAVDRSDQMLANYNIYCKCYKWWKALFFHMIDIAVVNSYILFQEHRRSNTDNTALHRKNTYSVVDFREALIRQICGFCVESVPPANGTIQPAHDYETVHIPETPDNLRRNCVVCYAAGRGEKKVSTCCPAPQCSRFMHVGGVFNCFKVWHSASYPGRR